MRKAHLWSPAIHEVLLCISFTHGGGLCYSSCLLCAEVYSAFLAERKREVAEGHLTSAVQESSPCGFLEDSSLTALKTDDGSITLLWHHLQFQDACGMRMESLVTKKARPDSVLLVLLPMDFHNKAFKTGTWLQSKAVSCVSPRVRNTCPEEGLYMGPFQLKGSLLEAEALPVAS